MSLCSFIYDSIYGWSRIFDSRACLDSVVSVWTRAPSPFWCAHSLPTSHACAHTITVFAPISRCAFGLLGRVVAGRRAPFWLDGSSGDLCLCFLVRHSDVCLCVCVCVFACLRVCCVWLCVCVCAPVCMRLFVWLSLWKRLLLDSERAISGCVRAATYLLRPISCEHSLAHLRDGSEVGVFAVSRVALSLCIA